MAGRDDGKGYLQPGPIRRVLHPVHLLASAGGRSGDEVAVHTTNHYIVFGSPGVQLNRACCACKPRWRGQEEVRALELSWSK